VLSPACGPREPDSTCEIFNSEFAQWQEKSFLVTNSEQSRARLPVLICIVFFSLETSALS
jgi:hypothetical protein